MKILAFIILLICFFIVASLFFSENKGKGSTNNDPVIVPPKTPEIVTEDLEEGEEIPNTEKENEIKRETNKKD